MSMFKTGDIKFSKSVTESFFALLCMHTKGLLFFLQRTVKFSWKEQAKATRNKVEQHITVARVAAWSFVMWSLFANNAITIRHDWSLCYLYLNDSYIYRRIIGAYLVRYSLNRNDTRWEHPTSIQRVFLHRFCYNIDYLLITNTSTRNTVKFRVWLMPGVPCKCRAILINCVFASEYCARVTKESERRRHRATVRWLLLSYFHRCR